jgi:sarcosine oxidase
MKNYDCIVIGMGGVGSAALWAGAKRGWSMLGIDQYGTAHDRGSSHGQTRIIRRAYYEHPSYVPLAERAFQLWDELTRRHRTSPDVKPLLLPSGLLQVGTPDSVVIQGVEASARQHGLAVERFSAEEIERRLPIFRIPGNFIGLYEANAGILRVELCVAAMLGQAVKLGASLEANDPVLGWEISSSGQVQVETAGQTFFGDRLIVAAGPWSDRLLTELELPLQVLRKQQTWFQLDRVEQKWINRFPAFLLEQSDGSVFYGIPEIDYLGMKVCEHSGGEPVSDPGQVGRELDRSELDRVREFLQKHFHFTHQRLVHYSQCFYTMTPDQHFILDLHPEFSQVALAAGLSGHGFKFAPLLGEYLVKLLNGEREAHFQFLRASRFTGRSGNPVS